MKGARIEDARGRIVREGTAGQKTVRLVGWVCDPVDPATKPAGGRPSTPVPVSKPSATKPAGGPSAPVPVSKPSASAQPSGQPSGQTSGQTSGQPSGPAAPIPFAPIAAPSGSAANSAKDYEYPSAESPSSTSTPSTSTPSTADLSAATADPSAATPSATAGPSAATPAKDYEYPSADSAENPSAAPEPSQNQAAIYSPAPKQLINLDGGTVTLGEWRQNRVLGEVVANYFRSADGAPKAKPVSIVALPSAAQSPAAQSPAAQSPAVSPSALEMQEADYEIDDSAVTAWQDPLLEGTFAPVDDGTKNESMAIWYVYTACWVGILGFWAYYWIRYKK